MKVDNVFMKVILHVCFRVRTFTYQINTLFLADFFFFLIVYDLLVLELFQLLNGDFIKFFVAFL